MQSINRGPPWLLLLLLLLLVTAAAGATVPYLQAGAKAAPNALGLTVGEAPYQPAAVQEVPTALDMVLMQQVVDDLGENEAISPFVMSTLMTQVWLGAGGGTRDEMTSILGLENAGTDVGQVDFLGGYSSAIGYLSSGNSSVTAAVFNRMYVRHDFTVKPSFSQTLREGYGSEAQTIYSAEEAATEINTAVSNVTQGRIPELVNAKSLEKAALVLVSALYFKGLWQHPFNPARKGTFLTAAGERQVDMMYLASTYLPYAYLDTFDAVSLSYTDPDYSLLLLRPFRRSMASVQALRDELGTLNITDIVDQLHDRRMSLSMPKFKIEAEYSLPDQLSALGIQRIFSYGADFSGITDDPRLYVSDVIHKVFMKVNEEGTEAAGAASVGFATFSRVPHVNLDRPFFAVVYNRQHSISLFSAYIASPTSDASIYPAEQEGVPVRSGYDIV